MHRENLDECPSCHSLTSVSVEEFETDGHDVYVRCRCEECGEVWQDVYRYQDSIIDD